MLSLRRARTGNTEKGNTYKEVFRICRTQNQDIPRAGLGGAARTAERRGWQGRAERDADGSVRPGKNRPSDAPANQRQTL